MDSLEELKQKLQKNKKISFLIKVSPGADKSEWKEALADGILRLKIKEAPAKGKANEAVLVFLAAEFGVKKKGVNIRSGVGARIKRIQIRAN